jgi:hypothetical protein
MAQFWIRDLAHVGMLSLLPINDGSRQQFLQLDTLRVRVVDYGWAGLLHYKARFMCC